MPELATCGRGIGNDLVHAVQRRLMHARGEVIRPRERRGAREMVLLFCRTRGEGGTNQEKAKVHAAGGINVRKQTHAPILCLVSSLATADHQRSQRITGAFSLPSFIPYGYVARHVMPRPPLSPLLCLLGLACQSLTGAAQPFAVQVIDESSHRGVPMVTLSTDNHIQLTTDSAGWVVMDEPGLMARAVHFIVSSPGYALPKDAGGRDGITLTLTPGQSAEIKLVRTAIAERMYRITGQGIYRESSLLGKEAPLPFPNINGDVLSLGRAQVASYQGRLVWAWPDTRLLAARNGPVVSGAAVDLPGAGGLDPTQGVHLRYFTNEQEETLPLLAVPKGQHAAIDGLMSVKDAIGAEHLLVH